MFKINAMDHIVLNVPDINRSLAFYMDVLGLAPERLDEFRRGEVRFPSVRISADTVIDLFPMKPGEALGDGPGLQSLNHFTMVVDAADFEGFQKHLAEHGVKIEEGPARRWGARGNGQSVYFRDPDGNRIEVRCYPSDASDAVSKGDRFGEWAAPLAGRRDTMIVATDRRLYVSTDKGLFQARSSGRGYTAQSLAFDRYAPMRWPVVVDSDNPRRLYAGTSKGGVFRSDDAGQSWREINQGIIYKEIWSVVQHPRTGELYVGTGPASVFKSLDRGESWIDAEQFRTMPESIDWTFPPAPHIAHVKGLALCASDPRVVFGAVEEGWLVRSCDGGVTWETLKNGTEFDSHYVALMPDDPAVILATSGNGFYRSTDGGDSFVRCTDGLDRSYFAQPVIHPARPNVVFTAASAVPPPGWRRPEGADAGFYRSEDQGLTWRRLTGGLPVHITAAPRSTAGDPESPDVFVVGMNDGTVWITEDGGESFHLALSGLPPVTAVSVAYA